MTAPLALPLGARLEFDVLSTDAQVMGVSIRRLRFPRVSPYRVFTLRYGPTTYADLDIIATARSTRCGATSTTLSLAGYGSVTGRLGPLKWRSRSPTAAVVEIEFEEIPTY